MRHAHPHACGGPDTCSTCAELVERRGLGRPFHPHPEGTLTVTWRCGATWTDETPQTDPFVDRHGDSLHSCDVPMVQRGDGPVRHSAGHHICRCRAMTNMTFTTDPAVIEQSRRHARETGRRYNPCEVTTSVTHDREDARA